MINERSWSERSGLIMYEARLSRDNLVIFDNHEPMLHAQRLQCVHICWTKRNDVCVTNNPFRTDCHLQWDYSLLDCVNQFAFEQLYYSCAYIRLATIVRIGGSMRRPRRRNMKKRTKTTSAHRLR